MASDDMLRDAYGMPRLPTPSDYGAVGDGIHDDTAAIQASIHGSASDETFTVTWYCHQHGVALEPHATVNLSATVMARVYVCPIDGSVIVHTSDSLTNILTMVVLADPHLFGGGREAALLALARSLVDDIDREAWVWGWQTDMEAARALLASE